MGEFETVMQTRDEVFKAISIFKLKRDILIGESIFKTQAKTQAHKTEEPTDAFFDYRVREVMSRDNSD